MANNRFSYRYSGRLAYRSGIAWIRYEVERFCGTTLEDRGRWFRSFSERVDDRSSQFAHDISALFHLSVEFLGELNQSNSEQDKKTRKTKREANPILDLHREQ